MLADDLLDMIVADLVVLADEGSFSCSVYESRWDLRITKLCGLIHDVYRRSNFRYLRGVYYYFTGRLYEAVDYRVFKFALRYFLRGRCVSDYDLLRSLDRSFLSAAYDAVWFNKLELQPNLLVFTNYVMDLDTFKCHRFSPEYGVISGLDYPYHPEAECPMWEEFLAQVLPEQASRDIIQMFFGLGFVHRSKFTQKLEKALMLVGQGGNGKGVVFETMVGVWGRFNISNMGMDGLTKGGDEGMRNMVMIEGKKFNYCEEVQIANLFKRSDALKAITSGEPQYGRILRHDIYEVRDIPFLAFNMNKMPAFDDDTNGLVRRFLIVSFTVTIPPEMQNKQLSYQLQEEYCGIFNWLRRGYERLKKLNYLFPVSRNGEKRTLDYIASNSPVWAFVYQRGFRPEHLPAVPLEHPDWVLADALYKDYLSFCDYQNCRVETKWIFASKLSEMGFEKKRCGKGTIYRLFRDARRDEGTIDAEMADFYEKNVGTI